MQEKQAELYLKKLASLSEANKNDSDHDGKNSNEKVFLMKKFYNIFINNYAFLRSNDIYLK